MAPTYHGAVPVPGQERSIIIGPYDSIPELGQGYARVVMLLRDQGVASPEKRFRLFGHVEEDGESRGFNEAEEAELGAVVDNADAYWLDRRGSD